jgi:hypothetical protein
MKKTVLLTIFAILAIAKCMSQGTYVVNNVPGSAANYHSLQNAIDSVPAGSIILLQNTGFNYGSASITKPLVIYGAGYFLGQNAGAATQASLAEAQVNYLAFGAGSEGSIVSGLHIVDSTNDAIGNARLSFGGTSNITVSRCFIDYPGGLGGNGTPYSIAFGGCSNIVVEQCYVQLNNNLIGISQSTSILIKNSIIVSPPGDNYGMVATGSTPYTYTVQNCTFLGQNGGGYFNGGSFYNNIFINRDTAQQTGPNTCCGGAPMVNALNNISNADFFYGVGANNTVNKALNAVNLLALYSNPAISSTDGAFELLPNSAAKNYGNDGTDAGAFGGSLPYVLSGIPAIPNIYFAQVPQTGTSTGGLQVHLKIQANN